MQQLVVIIEVFRKTCCREVFDLCVKHVRDRQPVFFEHIEEENEFILPLLAIVYVFLELHQQLTQVYVLLMQLVYVVLLFII